MIAFDQDIVPISEEKFWNFRNVLMNNLGIDCITERVRQTGDNKGNLVEGYATINIFTGCKGELPTIPLDAQEFVAFKNPPVLDDILKQEGYPEGYNIRIWKVIVKEEGGIFVKDNKTVILRLGGTIKYHPGVFNIEDFELGLKNSR